MIGALASAAKQKYLLNDLPAVLGTCKLGRLNNIDMCGKVKVRLPTYYTCSLDVELRNITGLDKMQMQITNRTQENRTILNFHFRFNDIGGKITLTPVNDCTILSAVAMRKLLPCQETNMFATGTVDVEIAFNIQTITTEVPAVTFAVIDITDINLSCGQQVLDLLAYNNFIKQTLLNLLRQKLSVVLKEAIGGFF